MLGNTIINREVIRRIALALYGNLLYETREERYQRIIEGIKYIVTRG